MDLDGAQRVVPELRRPGNGGFHFVEAGIACGQFNRLGRVAPLTHYEGDASRFTGLDVHPDLQRRAGIEAGAEAAGKLFAAAGGKILAYYVTLGEYDWLIVSEFPDHQAVSAAVLAAAGSGAVTDVRTTLAMTSAEAKGVFAATGKAARAYRAPGRAT